MVIKQEQNHFDKSWTTQRLSKKFRSSIPTKGNLMLRQRVSKAVWYSFLNCFDLKAKHIFRKASSRDSRLSKESSHCTRSCNQISFGFRYCRCIFRNEVFHEVRFEGSHALGRQYAYQFRIIPK